jgi:hypothetical protein
MVRVVGMELPAQPALRPELIHIVRLGQQKPSKAIGPAAGSPTDTDGHATQWEGRLGRSPPRFPKELTVIRKSEAIAGREAAGQHQLSALEAGAWGGRRSMRGARNADPVSLRCRLGVADGVARLPAVEPHDTLCN